MQQNDNWGGRGLYVYIYMLSPMGFMLDALIFVWVLEHKRAIAHATGVISSVKYLNVATSQ